MKYAECPAVTVAVDVDASPGAVWALVSDIGLSSRFSTEVRAARVPIEIGFGTNLIGPPRVIRQRLVDYERAGVTALRINLNRPFDRLVAELETLLDLTVQAGREVTDSHTQGATT